MIRRVITLACATAAIALVSADRAVAQSAAMANPAGPAVQPFKPSDLKWVRNAAGTQERAVLFGDPSKPEPYVARIKWLPGNMSRPHFHQNDRHFVVISGTWWLGSGEKYDPDSTVPVGPGTYVYHKAKGIHYDGSKNEEVIIQVWGIGPDGNVPAEKK
jgi:hypothetical protein